MTRQNKTYRRVAVKIGSNVLTRRDGTLDITRMSALVDQVAMLRSSGIEVIMISSGAVAAGRSELPVGSSALDSVASRQLFSAVGQAKLINRYYELFREHRLYCGQVLTLKESFSTRRHYLNQKNCMEVMLANGVIPVVNENDTVSVTELMFTDNDELSGLIASMMNADALVILSNVDGIYTGDPADPSSCLVEEVAPGRDLTDCINTTRSSAGRGGMTTKYRTATRVAAEGIDVIIACGKRDNILIDLLLDGTGKTPHTLFRGSGRGPSSMKKWLAHSEDFAKGSVTINDGAAQALLSRSGVSLLPVGVTGVDGHFDKDDIIQVRDSGGSTVAWGRAACGSDTARAWIERAERRPLIHADYLFTELNY